MEQPNEEVIHPVTNQLKKTNPVKRIPSQWIGDLSVEKKSVWQSGNQFVKENPSTLDEETSRKRREQHKETDEQQTKFDEEATNLLEEETSRKSRVRQRD